MSNLTGDSGIAGVPAVFGVSVVARGVEGHSTQNHGVVGKSVDGSGMFGRSGNLAGVEGHSTNGTGVFGISENQRGVEGHGTKDHGVVGVSTEGAGVFGSSANGDGVSGESTSRSGVTGRSASGIGVFGQGVRDAGVVGLHGDPQLHEIPIASNHAGVFGASQEGAGVMGYSRNTASFGVIAFGGIQASALNHPFAGDFEGDVHVHGNVDIRGDIFLPGADCAEQFDSAGVDEIEPGSVVVIDHQGALRQSDTAYDRKVAGVVSGAGRFRPGIVLDKQSIAANRIAVALVGKVYCKVDCQYGPIEIGDMLTSSPTAGHAMRAEDPAQAFGAVVGKALGACASGCVLIPILVSLQ